MESFIFNDRIKLLEISENENKVDHILTIEYYLMVCDDYYLYIECMKNKINYNNETITINCEKIYNIYFSNSDNIEKKMMKLCRKQTKYLEKLYKQLKQINLVDINGWLL